ncbi:MAG TPA: SDR family oxidoreductase [Steroidobacteraceae bacterium]|nr:SDR family oxidoreductase [Steroidobacteraceae bacterium]
MTVSAPFFARTTRAPLTVTVVYGAGSSSIGPSTRCRGRLVGTQLLQQLHQDGVAVRAMTRSREKAARLAPLAEAVLGDLDDVNTLLPIMRGIERLFLITGKTQQDRNALAAATQTGVRHVVKISTQEAGWNPVEGHGHWHKEREEIIRASGLSWTFLRPSTYMSFALSWASTIRREGTVCCAGGHGKLGPVDPWDVAAVAKAALIGPGHENMAYELTGPELLSFDDMADILAEVLGRAIRRVNLTGPQQAEIFSRMGLPKYTVDGLVETFSLVRAGRFAYLTKDVEKATGRQPRTFATWVREHVAALA